MIGTRDRIRLTVWLTLLTTGVEFLQLAADKLVFHDRIIYVGPDIVWLKPVANLLVFAAAAGVAFALNARWPRLVTTDRALAVLLFVSFSSVLFGVKGLHLGSGIVLALGLSVAAAYALTAREAAFVGIVRRSFLFVVGGGVLVGISVPLYRAVMEPLGTRRLAAARAGSPNVLFIVLDTVRADHLSLYGYPRGTTPRLERLAKHGVTFDQAVATAPWTLPSHASMFTGHMPLELSTDWLKALDRRWPTLAEVLRDRGYRTGGFSANMGYVGHEFGLTRGFAHYEGFGTSPGQLALSSKLVQVVTDTGAVREAVGYWHVLGRKLAADVNLNFLTWLSRNEDHPFFAFLNYFDAHEPLDPPPPFDRAFGGKFKSAPLNFSRAHHFAYVENPHKLSVSQVQTQINGYDDAIAYQDDQIGRLLDELGERGKLTNTLVIVAGDHGEEFGEHGEFSHGSTMYWTVLHVPLLISLPARLPSNRRVIVPVSLVDLPATIVDVMGLADGSPLAGTSLARFWLPGSENRDPRAVAEEKTLPQPMRSVVANNIHYIRQRDGVEELYDLARDPEERKNLLVGAGAREREADLSAFRCVIEKCDPDRD